jgi:hypothetical protein
MRVLLNRSFHMRSLQGTVQAAIGGVQRRSWSAWLQGHVFFQTTPLLQVHTVTMHANFATNDVVSGTGVHIFQDACANVSRVCTGVSKAKPADSRNSGTSLSPMCSVMGHANLSSSWFCPRGASNHNGRGVCLYPLQNSGKWLQESGA